jgi:hypothetical protein
MGANAFQLYSDTPSTHSECWCSSRAPRFDSVRLSQISQTGLVSLTRKRSLVQIQYGPRNFPKSCPSQ